MKESITKFDLEAAFKALDEIDSPATTRGLKANKPALTEIFSRKSKFDALFEDYYDVSNPAELSDAKADREAEVAKAKLARIEKIVDLDADSPDDLLTSYVGKFIVQCPQCMTLFYKKPEDIEKSEDDETTVNIGEVCQHCGNESGYTLIGKVGEASASEEASTETEAPTEEPTEVASEEPAESTGEDEDLDLDIDLEDTTEDDIEFDLDSIVDDEEETKEESFYQPYGNYLTENLNEAKGLDLEISDAEFKGLINSPEFKKPISDAEVRGMLDSFKEALTEETEVELGSLIAGDKFLKNGYTYEIARVDGNNKDITVRATGEKNPEDDVNTVGEILMRGSDKVKKLDETLSEGIFDFIGDKFKSMKRADQADWLLKNAMEDYSNAEFDENGNITGGNKAFKVFIVAGFKDSFSNGKLIKDAVAPDENMLVFGMKKVEVATKYADAEKLAKGWSMRSGNGPAFICLAKDADDQHAAFLCQFVKGQLDPRSDKLEVYVQDAKDDLKGKKLQTKGGADQTTGKPVPATDIKVGDKIDIEGEIVEVTAVNITGKNKDRLQFSVVYDDGSDSIETVPKSGKVVVPKK